MPGKVTADFADGVAILTIENPGRMNAMDDRVAEGLASGVANAKARGDVGAVILRGAGQEAFCAGVDLKFAAEFSDRNEAFARVGKHSAAFHADMASLPFPSIALIHGVCYGGGLHLALACDFRFAATSLRMVIPALKNGLLYPVSALERLNRLIGPSRARRMALEGAVLPPEILLQWGLIDELHPSDALDEKTLTFAKRLVAQPRLLVPHYMKILRAIEEGDITAANRFRDEARHEIGRGEV